MSVPGGQDPVDHAAIASAAFREFEAAGWSAGRAEPSNFLMPHVADLPAVVAELARVLAPAGRLALSTWDLPERARIFGAVPEAVEAAGARPRAALPPGRPFLQYAADDEFSALLEEAGLRDVEVRTVAFAHRLAAPDAFLDGLATGTVRFGALLSSQSEETRARIAAQYRRILAPCERDGGYDVPCSIKVGGGTVAAPD